MAAVVKAKPGAPFTKAPAARPKVGIAKVPGAPIGKAPLQRAPGIGALAKTPGGLAKSFGAIQKAPAIGKAVAAKTDGVSVALVGVKRLMPKEPVGTPPPKFAKVAPAAVPKGPTPQSAAQTGADCNGGSMKTILVRTASGEIVKRTISAKALAKAMAATSGNAKLGAVKAVSAPAALAKVTGPGIAKTPAAKAPLATASGDVRPAIAKVPSVLSKAPARPVAAATLGEPPMTSGGATSSSPPKVAAPKARLQKAPGQPPMQKVILKAPAVTRPALVKVGGVNGKAPSGVLPKGAPAAMPKTGGAVVSATAVAAIAGRPKASEPHQMFAESADAEKRQASPEGSDEDPEAKKAKLSRGESWREFEGVDPLYALLGELGQKKVVTPEGDIDEETLHGYLERLTKAGVTSKNKDWVEVWATMGIPIEKQDQVLAAILQIGLESEIAETVPEILTELVKGHRCKMKAVEEAIGTVFECGNDEQGCLAKFLHLIFPKSPTSAWGWSRVGWNWQQWWSTADKILSTLDPSSAFECLRDLLTSIEAGSGGYLPHQQIWDETRLALVRAALCRYGQLEEDELPAAIDLVLQ